MSDPWSGSCLGSLSSVRTTEEVDALAQESDAFQDNLKVTVRVRSAHTVVELEGELDLATAPILRETLVLLEPEGGINLELDLRGLTFLGSTGVGVIVAVCKRVRGSGGAFSVSCDHGLGRRTLEIAGLVDYLEILDSEEPHLHQ